MAKQVLNYHDVQLYESDVALFEGQKWLNDNAINFYLQYITQTIAPSDVLLIDPAVVSCLLYQCEDEEDFKELAAGLCLKSKRICLIPVSDNDRLGGESSHWSLLLYCDENFKHFDSISGCNKNSARRIARSFMRLLKIIGRYDGVENNFQVKEVLDAPQQQNSYDCGMYVILLAEFLTRQYAGEMEKMSMEIFLTPEKVTGMRLRISKLLKKLQE
ncbi:hypothetical protein CCR75_003662 [Bremia lactucae]|uniref:Ubiquitin-like protease family profile domain-containing protein n=1 Tax=Bremia lactucae TaxID=4779 RepID=A0A976NXX9_BRELC|nr:hypothetical protein CCR75_003662 [Bremia lactucae]